MISTDNPPDNRLTFWPVALAVLGKRAFKPLGVRPWVPGGRARGRLAVALI